MSLVNKFHHRLRQPLAASPSSIHYDSLRVLEWDKLCDLVASFATTSLAAKLSKFVSASLRDRFLFASCLSSLFDVMAIDGRVQLWSRIDLRQQSETSERNQCGRRNAQARRMIEQVIDENGSVKDSAEKVGLSDPDSGKGKSKMSKQISHGFHLVKGKSAHAMEDYLVAKFTQVDDHELGLFAIFDGHMGHDVADYLQSH
ncbi:hypothetical protein K1719_020510 [Acacia pycnantha]|nr:hypothetical protein K1719_020510 [Acacia pycnantha]